MAAVTSRQPVVIDDDDDERSDAGFNSIWGSDVESEPDNQSEFEDLPSLPGPSTHKVRYVEPVMTGAWPPEDGGGTVSLRTFSCIYLQLMAFARFR
jgi:hypothetical protein